MQKYKITLFSVAALIAVITTPFPLLRATKGLENSDSRLKFQKEEQSYEAKLKDMMKSTFSIPFPLSFLKHL